MISQELPHLERQLREQVSIPELQKHLEIFSELFRDTGSEDEWKAAWYIHETLSAHGVEAEILEFDSLISWPLEGRLVILGEHSREVEEIPVRTRSFGVQTQPGGVEAELVFVPFTQPQKGEMIFTHRALAGDYQGLDVHGKLVITADGGPDGVLRAQERGAAGHIHIWTSDEDLIHEMICTSIWGTPTPESAKRLPQIPSLGVKQADGAKLEQLLASGRVRARIESNVKTEWMRVPLVTAYIPSDHSDDFLLVGAHIDSWYEGVTDNATGDAALIEMARVLPSVREQLHSGVRFCWWPGHSTGRYSGSTWYADNAFSTLREHCLGYLNIDSPGVRETEIWDCRYNTGEIEHITSEVVHKLSGQQPNIRRPLRAGDQSFLGIGLPSLGAFRMLPVDHDDRKAVGGSGGAYWWHTPEDTLDKADANILAKDTEIYLTMVLRMCSPEVIPYRFSRTALDFIEGLSAFQEAGGDHLDLSDAISAAERFRDATTELEATRPVDVPARNWYLKQLAREVNPVLFTINGPYEMDPALQLPVLPGLAPIRELIELPPDLSEYRFLRTQLMRQRNRTFDCLTRATVLAEKAIEH